MQVHKFLNRNRDHLDPAVVEMLAQSQLQVPLLALLYTPPGLFCPPCPDSLAQGAGLQDTGTLSLWPAHPGTPGSGDGAQARLWTGPVSQRSPCLTPQLVSRLFQDAEPDKFRGGPGKPTLATCFQKSLGDLLAQLGR